MRSIYLNECAPASFVLNDDPQQLIGDFLWAALHDPDHSPKKVRHLLSNNANNYYLIGKYNLFMVEYPDELPENQLDRWADALPDTEIWLLSHETTCQSAVLIGDELRYLFDQAQQLLAY